MRYTLGLKKYWWSWFKQDLQRFYYKTIYKFNMNSFNGTMLPKTGKGKYVSVYCKGDIIQIIDERGENNEIRIIPYQPNHGIMIESLKNGKLVWRNLLDITQLNNHLIYYSNIETLVNKEKHGRYIEDE
jgi:hypothetical protein